MEKRKKRQGVADGAQGLAIGHGTASGPSSGPHSQDLINLVNDEDVVRICLFDARGTGTGPNLLSKREVLTHWQHTDGSRHWPLRISRSSSSCSSFVVASCHR